RSRWWSTTASPCRCAGWKSSALPKWSPAPNGTSARTCSPSASRSSRACGMIRASSSYESIRTGCATPTGAMASDIAVRPASAIAPAVRRTPSSTKSAHDSAVSDLGRAVSGSRIEPANTLSMSREVFMGRNLLDKVWEAHAVRELPSGQTQLFIGLHLIHEVTSPQAFQMMREQRLGVAFPDRTFATVDHIIPTDTRQRPYADSQAEGMMSAIERNCREFGIRLFDAASRHQGIVPVLGPELSIAQ